MRRNRLGIFDCTSVFEIGGDSCGPEGVATGPKRQTNRPGPALDHPKSVVGGHAIACESSRAAIQRAKEGILAVTRNASGANVSVEVRLSIVMRRDLVVLAAFFVKAQPPALAVLPVVLHIHIQHRANAGKAEDKNADQSPVAQARDRFRVDAIEQLARLPCRQDRCFALFDNVFWPANAPSWVDFQVATRNQPIEAHANGRQMLLDGRRRVLPHELFDIKRDSHRVNFGQPKASRLTPRQETPDRIGVGDSRVAIANGGSEEFNEPIDGVPASFSDDRRHRKLRENAGLL